MMAKTKSIEPKRKPAKVVGIILTIVGGFLKRGIQKNARKRHLQFSKRLKQKLDPMVTFFEEDYISNFDWEHNELMVIIVIIHNYAINIILANQWTLNDILHTHVPKAKHILINRLNQY